MESIMKKIFLGAIILFLCMFICPLGVKTKAETEQSHTVETLYPNGILYYQNLANIDQLSVSNNFIAYNLAPTEITILNKNSQTTTKVTSFDNIFYIKFVNSNQLIVVDYNTELSQGNLKLITITENNNCTITTLPNIELLNLKLIDIYSVSNKVYIGIIDSKLSNYQFRLFLISDITTSLESTEQLPKYTSDLLEDATLLTINDKSFFAIINIDTTQHLIYKSYSTDTVSIKTMTDNVTIKNLDYIKINNTEYLITITQEILNILDINDPTNVVTYLQNINIDSIDTFKNTIFATNIVAKSITPYSLVANQNTLTINKENPIITSKDKSFGRFNSVSDINVQGNTIIVSDTNNNRIQIIENNESKNPINEQINTSPRHATLDSKQDLYYIKDLSEQKTSLVKYSYSNNGYSYQNEFSKYNDTNLTQIADLTIDNKDTIYLIEYSTNKLLKFSTTRLEEQTIFSEFQTNANTKIEYIKGLNKIVILTDKDNSDTEDIIYLIDPDKLTNSEPYIEDSLTISDCKDISADLFGIYLLKNNSIEYINISNNTMTLSHKQITTNEINHFSAIKYDITNSRLLAFNTDRQCINYINVSLGDHQLTFSEIKTNEPLSSTNSPLAITIVDNGIIYDSPHYLGNYYLNVDTCIGIELYEEYYRVLFKDDGVLKSGFLHKDYAKITPHNTSKKLKVLTTNFHVSVYRFPTLLQYENQPIITSELPINVYIYISSTEFPISIDSKKFYLYETSNGEIGYIFNADVILDDSTHITLLNTENASINAIGKDSITLYSEDKTTSLIELNNGDRIYVENFDKNSEYTKVIYKDTDLNTIEGYIRTEYIEMDKLDNSKIVLILLISLSVVLLIVITICYIRIKRKK